MMRFICNLIALCLCIGTLHASNIEAIEHKLTKVPPTLIGLSQIVLYEEPQQDQFRSISDALARKISPSSKTSPYIGPGSGYDFIVRSTWSNLIGLREEFEPLNPKKLPPLFNSLINRLKQTENNKSEIAALIFAGQDLLLKAINVEYEAIAKDCQILWRFSMGKKQDGAVLLDIPLTKDYPISYSLSLLGGYIQDGFQYCDPMEGLGNYSACTYCYWIIHNKMKQEEKKLRETEGINPDYIKYLDGLKDHSIYGLEISKLEKNKLRNALCFPEIPLLLQACSGHGEYFHPSINEGEIPQEETKQYKRIMLKLLQEAPIIFFQDKVLEKDQVLKEIEAMKETYSRLLG